MDSVSVWSWWGIFKNYTHVHTSFMVYSVFVTVYVYILVGMIGGLEDGFCMELVGIHGREGKQGEEEGRSWHGGGGNNQYVSILYSDFANMSILHTLSHSATPMP